jgi:hypothetical protein
MVKLKRDWVLASPFFVLLEQLLKVGDWHVLLLCRSHIPESGSIAF